MAVLDTTDRRLLRLAGPAFLTLLAEPLYVLVDTAIVGHLGTEPLAGLAVAGTVLSTLTWLVSFLASGVATQVGTRLGAGDEIGARHALRQGIPVALVLSMLSALITAGGAGPLARFLHVRGEAFEAAVTYLRISAIGIPALVLTLLMLGWYRGTGDLAVPVRVTIGANVANLMLEVLLVWGLRWGIAGSAAATVAVQWVAVLIYLARLGEVVRIEPLDMKAVGALGRIGAAMVVRTGFMVGTISLATWIVGRAGSVSLAAHQIGMQVYLFLALGTDALAWAAQSLFAAENGRAQNESAQMMLWPLTKRLIRLGVIIGGGLVVVLSAVSPLLVRVFTSDPQVLSSGRAVLLWCALLQLTASVVFVLDGVLMGADLFPHLAVGAALAASVFAVVAIGGGAFGAEPAAGQLTIVWVALNAWMAARFAGNTFIAVRWLRNGDSAPEAV